MAVTSNAKYRCLSSKEEPEYKNIPSALMNLVLMFRNAIGDYQIPNYKYWSTQLDEARRKGGNGSVLEPSLMVYVIWLFWFGIIIFLPINIKYVE